MTERREDIVRAIRPACISGAGYLDGRPDDDTCFYMDGIINIEENVDSLLVAFPVLGGVTEEMIDAGARAIVHEWLRTTGTEASFDEVAAGQMPLARRESRAVLAAVLGDGSET